MPTPESPGRREAVLGALRAADGPVSGESLARALGVSRAAIAKHIGALRDGGYRITSVGGVGYRLDGVPDAPLPAEVSALLAPGGFGALRGGGVTASTNDDARALARAGAPEGTVVLARVQTGGRGRLGRSWESPDGGVYLSVVLRPPLALQEAGPLPLVVGIGVAAGLEALGAAVGLKWPNDVLVMGPTGAPEGKVAGILLESMAEGERIAWVVAGIGVDVRRPERPTPGAAYLADLLDPAPGRAAVAAAVLDGVSAAYRDFVAHGFAGSPLAGGQRSLAARWDERSVLRGREVEVRDMRGDVVAAGAATGVDADGRLLVERDGAVSAVAAGEVTLRR